MNRTATQLHGYRQGHQLLSGKPLDKGDQGLIDRLSDLAGPLRPGETFEAYFTGYPLPSKKFYVLARTWQDLTISRAGCVRTLSLIIPVDQWLRKASVQSYFKFLANLAMPDMADTANVEPSLGPLDLVQSFDGRELLEALFLEDSKAVVVFDAPRPERIAARILTALWPGMKERFSISTFALSPRKIEDSDFNLVFAPKDAKARFTNWNGRRIDARSPASARHRWTDLIVDRVFRDPEPNLLDARGVSALDKRELSAPSALRVSLLWDELLHKLETSPSAALGLLDVANSKFSSPSISEYVAPLLANAAMRAALEMGAADGWALVAAMLRKVQGSSFSSITPRIAEAGRVLTGRFPAPAISLLEQPDPSGSYSALLPSIAAGLRDAFDEGAEAALKEALPETLLDVVLEDNALARLSVKSPALLERIEKVLPAVSQGHLQYLREALLPLLVTKQQFSLAAAFISTLSVADLYDEVDLLDELPKVPNGYARVIVARARAINDELGLREKALTLGNSRFADQILTASLMPVSADVRWVFEVLPTERAHARIARMLASATVPQLQEMLGDDEVARQLVCIDMGEDQAVLIRIAAEVWLPLDLLVSVVNRIDIVSMEPAASAQLTAQVLQRCLRDHFPGDESAFLRSLLQGHPTIDASWLIHHGLAGHVSSSVISRNLCTFGVLEGHLCRELVKTVDSVGEVLSGRWTIDIDADAAAALTNLLVASEHQDQTITLRAAGHLLPALMRSKDRPISSVIAATFPYVYAELAREDDVPDLLRFIPFVDWDRCKAARHELVDAFLSSDPWQPRDFAYTAWRCRDTERFIRRLLKDDRGIRYLDRIAPDLNGLPTQCADDVRSAIASLHH